MSFSFENARFTEQYTKVLNNESNAHETIKQLFIFSRATVLLSTSVPNKSYNNQTKFRHLPYLQRQVQVFSKQDQKSQPTKDDVVNHAGKWKLFQLVGLLHWKSSQFCHNTLECTFQVSWHSSFSLPGLRSWSTRLCALCPSTPFTPRCGIIYKYEGKTSIKWLAPRWSHRLQISRHLISENDRNIKVNFSSPMIVVFSLTLSDLVRAVEPELNFRAPAPAI